MKIIKNSKSCNEISWQYIGDGGIYNHNMYRISYKNSEMSITTRIEGDLQMVIGHIIQFSETTNLDLVYMGLQENQTSLEIENDWQVLDQNDTVVYNNNLIYKLSGDFEFTINGYIIKFNKTLQSLLITAPWKSIYKADKMDEWYCSDYLASLILYMKKHPNGILNISLGRNCDKKTLFNIHEKISNVYDKNQNSLFGMEINLFGVTCDNDSYHGRWKEDPYWSTLEIVKDVVNQDL
jgi:hypothetical protein